MSSGAQTDLRPDAADTAPARIDTDFTSFDELKKIGSGGNADVTKVRFDGEGPEICALKQPRMQGTLDTDSISEFTAEAETWQKLDDHDYIVSVLDYGSQPLPWIALEYMDGGSLDERLGELDPEYALWIGVCIARAVRHAHRRGIAHLDLKPENVLFAQTDRGTWDVPKVTDWGLAKMLLDHSQSVQGLSPQYAAPEQFDDETYGHPDDYTDIYATGAVVYAALVGEPPFTGAAAAVMHNVLESDPEPPSEHVDDLPEGTDEVLMRALAKDKADRYESILDFRRDLERLLERALGNDATGSLDDKDNETARNSNESSTTNTDTAQRQTPVSGGQSTGGGDQTTESIPEEAQSTLGSTEIDSASQGPTSVSGPEKAQTTGETAETNAAVFELGSITFRTHHLLYGSLLAFLLGVGSGGNSGVGSLFLLSGLIGFLYAWNKEMVLLQRSKTIEWSPRRYLYYGGLIIYMVSVLVYFYKRHKSIGLFGTIEA